MLALAYLAGLASIVPLYALFCAVVLAVGDGGGVQCVVCDHLDVDMNEHHSRAYVWARKVWHRIWWRPRRWHRIAAAAHRAKWAHR